MLKENDVDFEYREYRESPLAVEEIRTVLGQLHMNASEVLRRNDRVAKEIGLTGEESDERLIALMAEHPTLLQRPIGVMGGRAVVGRPPENLLDLAQ